MTYKALSRSWLEGKTCKMCGSSEVCVHHKQGRLGKLLTDTRHWVALCKTHHNWVHNNMESARAWGLLCPKGFWNRYEP